ncbi:PHP domain-containing protein [Desulfovibrio sp. X2]|uniref:PHP domain-containing protein n=1 Tax=Desulfovibrio sp. X2 TaxID=941449 RepID=UPI0003F95E7E|nr:PHP domain-containing protein [Desulfovibrio sp. X2]
MDLHTHSTASDGTCAPAEVVRLAHEAGLAAVALTDHDTVDGLAEAGAEAARIGIEFVRGCELAAKSTPRTVDILGLWLPEEPERLTGALAWLIEMREERNREIIRTLAKLGVPVSYEDLLAEAGGTIGRPHIAKLLVRTGFASSVQDAFDVFLKRGGKAHVPKTALSDEEAVELLKSEGATVILAHPGIYNLSIGEIEPLVKRLKGHGLDGIEARYTEHAANKTREYLCLAERLDLVVSGGSDFHGSIKPGIRIGVGKGNLTVPHAVLDALKEHRARQGLPV